MLTLLRGPQTRAVAVLLLAVAVLASCSAGTAEEAAPDAGPAATPTPAGTTPEGSAGAALDSEPLQSAVGVDGIRAHLEELQRIADQHGGNRAAGTPGYDASVAYVQDQLTAAGYETTLQEFDISTYEENSPAVVEVEGAGELTPRVDTVTVEFSPPGEATGPLAPVDLQLPPGGSEPTSGCEPEDFAGFPRGAVALLQRGTCTYQEKVAGAEEAGAVAALVFNDGQPGRSGAELASLGEPGAGIPAVSLSFEAGERLAALEGGAARVVTDTVSESYPTSNVIAETPGGDPDQVVMVGGHLDSVPEGPGINDNGTGVATVLEIARAMAAETRANKVRFAFWGGEELGLLGSRHYAEQLSEDDARRIAAYLNFDMVGSPNYTRYVYSSTGAPPGSDVIEQGFHDHFAERDLPVASIDLVGRSDHAALADLGIPVGGLFSGAEMPEENEDVGEPGGLGEPNDACYHQACDTLDNVDDDALDQFSDAAAHMTATLAASTEEIARESRR
jgi:Zn-dependent M28 family amino/carboxypeptidase